MRKLAKIAKIEKIEKHPNADTLDVCTIGGWNVIAKSNLHKLGDLVVYCEIDSWIPYELAPFLTKEGSEPKIFNNVKGQVLKTVRLRGLLSQGLILPIRETILKDQPLQEGDDVTEVLSVLKYEKPLPATLAGVIRGAFPGIVPKTDAERIQNLYIELEAWCQGNEEFNVTEKLDGCSATFIKNNNDIHVCSRNWSLCEDESNTFWKIFNTYNIKNALNNIPFNCAIQGEIVGPGIQENMYQLHKPTFFIFNIYNIDKKQYISFEEMKRYCAENNLNTVPYISTTTLTNDHTITNLLNTADGISSLNEKVYREGLVYRGVNNLNICFKTISNTWLLKK